MREEIYVLGRSGPIRYENETLALSSANEALQKAQLELDKAQAALTALGVAAQRRYDAENGIEE